MDFVPIVGFGRKPGVPLPPIPTMEDLQPLIDGRRLSISVTMLAIIVTGSWEKMNESSGKSSSGRWAHNSVPRCRPQHCREKIADFAKIA